MSTVDRGNSTGLKHKPILLSSAVARVAIRILYTDNKILLVNGSCKCLHFLNYIKEKLNLLKDDHIDLIDVDGTLREIPLNYSEYAIDYLTPSGSYLILRIDTDQNTGEKRYVPMLNDARLTNSLIKSISNLNNGRITMARERMKAKEVKRQQTIDTIAVTVANTPATYNQHASHHKQLSLEKISNKKKSTKSKS